MPFAGGCQCGAVRFEAAGAANDVALCHCVECRRSSGAPAMVWAGYGQDKIKITKGQPAIYQSFAVSTRSFCGACGTGLFYNNSEMLPGLVEVQAAAFDDPEAFAPTSQIQVAERLSWMPHAHMLTAFERFPE